MLSALPEVEALPGLSKRPRCGIRLQITDDVTEWPSWPQCPRNAVWLGVTHCPMGHVNNDLACDQHKQEAEHQMFSCNTCGFVTPATETVWQLL